MSDTKQFVVGSFVRSDKGYYVYAPADFPPPGLSSESGSLAIALEKASVSLGRLDYALSTLTDSDPFIVSLLRRDYNSHRTSISAPGPTGAGGQYDPLAMLEYLKATLAEEHAAVTLSTMRNIHLRFFSEAGSSPLEGPGRLRHRMRWVGGTSLSNARFVPPDHDGMKKSLNSLEKFMRPGKDLPVLVRAGMIYVQLMTLFPFVDGNARVDSVLVAAYLSTQKLVSRPVLLLSPYFQSHQEEYVRRLYGYNKGDVLEWLDFFLTAVRESADKYCETVEQVNALQESDRAYLSQLSGSVAENTSKVLSDLYCNHRLSASRVSSLLDMTFSGSSRLIKRLVQRGILVPLNPGKKYAQQYEYKKYADLFR